MKFKPISQNEFNTWAEQGHVMYAKRLVEHKSYDQEAAIQFAIESFNKLLPNGMATKNNFIYVLENGDADTVGYLWYQIRKSGMDRRAFLCDFLINENFRGKGYGKQAMKLLEDEVKKMGISLIGLHVFHKNETALSLYKSLGFEITDHSMVKDLRTEEF